MVRAHRMMKIIALILATSCALAHAASDDIVFTLRNGTDTGQGPFTPPHPTTGIGLVQYDSSTHQPSWVNVGTGLTISSGILSATAAAQLNADWNAVSGVAQILNKPTLALVATSGAYGDLSGRPSLAAVATSGSASDLTTGTISTARLPALAISQTAGLQSAIDAKFTIPSGTTSQYVRGDGSLATLPTAATPSQSGATRTINSAFQVSSTRNALAFYSVQCTITASIAGGQNCDVVLEIASDSGFTANVQMLAISGTGQTYTLAVAIQGVQPQTAVVSGFVPAGYYARIRTVNNTGSPAFSYRAGQEVLL